MKFSFLNNRNNLILVGIAVANIVLHLLFYANLEFHRDELLYFSLGLHPDFGYATVPPLIGWLASLMQAIFGYSLFAVKLFPALLSGALVLLSAKISKELGGRFYAQVLTGIAIVCMPVGLRAFHLFQPVPIDLFLWTLLLFYTIRYVNTKEDKYLLILGVVSGIGMLNKYLIALLIIALMVSILFSSHRSIFKNKALYKGMAIGLALLVPNIIWQLTYDFPVIEHMSALNDSQLVYVNRFDFLMDQLLMTFSVCVIVLVGFIYLLRQKKYRYVAITAFIVTLVLFVLRGKSYYTIGLIPVMIAAGSLAIEGFIKNRVIRALIPVAIILITLPLLPVGLPVYDEKGLVQYFKDLEEDYGLEIGRRFEDGTIHSLPQDYADQLGWEELTKITDQAYKSINANEKAVIYCSNYGQAGAIAVIGKKYGLPEPVSFHESFLYWAPKEFDTEIEYLIYINDELGENVAELFTDIQIIGQISNVNAREYGTTVYLCSKPKGSFNEFYREVLESVESPF